MHLQPGTLIGNYIIDALAGHGGMGEVYLAHDPRLNRSVAIKILPAEWSRDRARRDRFEREARITSSLNHPNLVVLHDIGEHEECSYFVMEYIAGETLADRLRRGPLPVAAVARLGAQIADGLASAHEAGVVHRDLKPANIMLTAGEHVKILDFGLGKWTMPSSEADDTVTAEVNITRPGDVLGTASYMSPEQASGRSVDHQSDQFALGVILHEMLTGRHPFARQNQLQTLNAIVGSPAPALDAGVPILLRQTVERCLDKVPERRFAHTSVLARALHDVDDACRGERMPEAVPAARGRSRRPIVAAAVIVALLVAAVPAARWLAGNSASAPAQIAIIPFTNANGDTADQALVDGLADVLSRQLAALEQPGHALRIVPAAMVRQQRAESPADARRAFGVDTAIVGRLQPHGAGLRLSLNRFDTISGRLVDEETVEVATRDAATLLSRALERLLDLLDLTSEPRARGLSPDATTQAPGTAEFYLQGRGYLQRYELASNIDAAIALFERALTLAPNDALVHAALAEGYWRRYELARDATWAVRAQAAGTAALRHNPHLSQVRITLGLLANGTGQYETAAVELKKVLENEPSNPDAFRELGRAYEGLGDATQAESVLKAAVTARPSDWSVYNALGAFYMRQRRPADAAVQFERVVQLTPDNSRGFTNLGSAYGQLREWDKAFTALQKATTLSPNDRTWANLATAYFRQGRFADAAAAFERAIALGATNHQVWFNMASALSAVPGRESRAKEAYLKAAELGEAERRINPRQAALLARLADCYANVGSSAQARALALEAEGLAPKDAGVWLITAQVFERLGDRAGALQRVSATLQAGLSRADVESTRGLDALRKDPAYASLLR
ncbi:MAG TPA: protein kinase [Vicinamibacterales bacterium]|nr:protein kinase [Vicinamibacterales bacterium]